MSEFDSDTTAMIRFIMSVFMAVGILNFIVFSEIARRYGVAVDATPQNGMWLLSGRHGTVEVSKEIFDLCRIHFISVFVTTGMAAIATAYFRSHRGYSR